MREKEEWLPRATAALCNNVCESNESRVEWLLSSSFMYLCYSLSLSLIILTFSIDVDGLSNHIKYCIGVLSLQWTTIRTSSVGIPNIFFMFNFF